MGSEDFFDSFKDRIVSNTKKFNFKKVNKTTDDIQAKEAVTSPFFDKNVKPKTIGNESQNKSNEKLDISFLKDNVEKELYNIFNDPFEDDTFLTKTQNGTVKSLSNEASSKIKKTSNTFLKTKVHDVKRNTVKQSDSKSVPVAPVFLFNKKNSKKSEIKPESSCNAPNNISAKQRVSDTNQLKHNQNHVKQKQVKSNTSEYTFKLKQSKSIHDTNLSNIPKETNLKENDNSVSKSEFSHLKKNCDAVNHLDRNELKVNIDDQSNTDGSLSSSPVIRQKKFVFRRKLSTSSSSSLSQLTAKKSPRKSPQQNKLSETPKKNKIDSPILINSGESLSVDKKVVSPKQITEVKKNLFSDQKILDDTISFVSQSLEASEADYMTDEQFEKLFGNLNAASSQFDNTTCPKPSTSKSSHDEFNLNDVDWDECFDSEKTHSNSDDIDALADVDWKDDVFSTDTAPPPEFLGIRGDDSAEFKKNYHFSSVMMEVLHQRFGLRTFRPHQREVINASLTRHDCFVLMPTGGGKSLCYQLPAILSEGVTIVISPLRALISDQVDKLNGLDIPAAHLCSDVSAEDTRKILAKLHMREPGIKLLYLTPEKIMASKVVMDLLESLYQRDKLARVVIDEAHCLSQWGHDFRPDYKQLSILRKKFVKVPIICLTATATKEVETDVINSLQLRNVKRFIRSFNRPNIKYRVLPKSNKIAVNEISNLIKKNFRKQSGIIYCLSRNDCETLADMLNKEGIKTRPYHAGMSDKIRESIQKSWMQDQFYVIVATIAFGMGIDKPDVRFVIHNSIPKSVEAFYQESGRAGRDGETSYSYLFYNYVDVGRLQTLMQMDKNAKKSALEGHMENLKQMVAFAENVVDCRRHLQLLHLGENFDRQICIRNKQTTCDNCENFKNYNLVDFTKEAKELGILVKDLSVGYPVTLIHVADVYRGSKIKKILQRGHDSHKYYGAGSKMDRHQVNRILTDLILKNILTNHHTYTGQFPVVYIKPGLKFNILNSPDFKFSLPVSTKPMQYPELTTPSKPNKPVPEPSSFSTSVNKPRVKSDNNNSLNTRLNNIRVQCHEALLEECRKLALEKNVTISSIMNLSALKSMAEVLPKNREEFLKIQHVTVANFNKFGEYFLKITTKYREQIDALQRETSNELQSSSFEEDDWRTPKKGTKRKSTGGYKKGNKKFKRSYKGKSKKSYRKPKTTKGGTPKKKVGKTKGGLGLMPVN